MDDEAISMFCSFTAASPDQGRQYLALTDGNVEQAVELFFSNPDLGASAAASSQPPPISNRDDPIMVDDDDGAGNDGAGGSGGGGATSFEDDEAMARRLQQEMYGGAGGAGGAGQGEEMDAEGVRAPMARTTETLVGPNADWTNDPNEMRAAVAEQMMARQQRRAGPGIFNQRESASIWAQDDPNNAEIHRQVLSRATGGASEQTSKSNLLADLFRPPFDLISQLSFSTARDEGKENAKWILVNVQNPSIFDCQVLNRDIWKNQSIRDTIKEHFIFLQYNKDDPRGREYVNYYFRNMLDNEDAYPHIAIVDPRTGEQVKTWSGSPAPKAADFLMDLHEFLDRYSLNMGTRNPVQTKRKESKKDVAQMSEEEMLEMALQNSLANGGEAGAARDGDPDALTRPGDVVMNGKGKAPMGSSERIEEAAAAAPASSASNGNIQSSAPTAVVGESRLASISSTTPHTEPESTDPKETTRIQFRYSGGRVVRRFLITDPVSRIYEWLKSAPLEGKQGADFELISMGKNLIEVLTVPIGEAGLKQGTVMVEFVED